MRLNFRDIARAIGANAPAVESEISGWSVDTRTLAPGDMYFALRGENRDGHEYVGAAMEKGAAGAVVERPCGFANELVVSDSLRALQCAGAWARRQWGGTVVAVTGSAGKTTTKDAIAHLLAVDGPVGKTVGNFNNHIGVPLSILRLPAESRIGVIEMGMNHAGEIAVLARIASPDWGVVTNVGTAHIENFSDGQAGIARAKFELVEALPLNGVAFLNCDDPYVSQFGRDFMGQVVYFGAGPCADPQFLDASEDLEGLHVRFRAGKRMGKLTLHLLGAHNASNALAGLAVALEAGVDLDEAVAAL